MTSNMAPHPHHAQHQPHSQDQNLTLSNPSFFIAISVNAFFVVLQMVFSYRTNSTSLLADACHNLGDVFSLSLAWGTLFLMKRKPTERATYGLKKTSILAALINGALLIFSCGVIATKAMYQFFSPSPIYAVSVMFVAGIGVLVNGLSAMLFLKESRDLNIRGAYLHLLSDALISLGVVCSAGLLYLTSWLWIDPLVGLFIALVILKGTWSLFADSFRLIIDAVPKDISWSEVSAYFLDKPGVEEIHDLHIWAMSTSENALSVHVLMPQHELMDEVRSQWAIDLNTLFNIQHVTIQVENTKNHCNEACYLEY